MTAAQRSIFDDLVKQAENAFDSIKKLIVDNITGPMGDIGNLKDKLLRLVNDLIAQVKDKYNEEINNIIGDVQNMVECYQVEAEKLHINIKDCYDQTEDQILALPQGFLTNITKCGTNEYETGIELIKKATSLFDGVIKDFNAIPDRIEQCTKESWWSASTCITGVITDIAKMAISIPTKVAPELQEYVNKITNFITGVPARIQVCGTTTVTVFAQTAIGVGYNFVDCVKDKFPNPNICLPA